MFLAGRCRSISDSVTDGTDETSLKLILCTIKLMSQHFLYYPPVTILLYNSALTKSSKVSLEGLLSKSFVRPVNP